MLSEKDHIKIVKIFNDWSIDLSGEREKGKAEIKIHLATSFMTWLKEDNPAFDQNKFIKTIKIF